MTLLHHDQPFAFQVGDSHCAFACQRMARRQRQQQRLGKQLLDGQTLVLNRLAGQGEVDFIPVGEFA